MRVERFGGSLCVVFLVVFLLTGSSLESASFIRGDADASGNLDLSDGIRVLGYLFLGSPATLDCEDAADVDASGTIDLSDAVYLLSYLFLGGEAPAAPFPTCGPNPPPGGLGCASYPRFEETTSFELIDRALAAGEISDETALIYRVFHVYEDDRLPGAFRGAGSGLKDTHLIADVLER